MQVDNFEAGGLENVVLDLVQVLSRADYKVVLVVLGQAGTGVARARDQGTPVAVLEKCDETYRALLARLRPQLALTHYSPFGARACAEAGIPFLQVIHNIYLWLSGAELAEFRASARHTTGFIAVSESARRYSIARLGLDPAHCISIPNGIDTDRYRPSAAGVSRATKRAELGIGVDDYVFLAVGSINHQKNHLAALQAFAAAAGAMPHAKLVILGPVYERLLFAELNDCITAHGLAGRAIYAGAASCVQPYYAMADALVISAFFEGGPLTLLEALTANLAVIATEVGFAPHFAGMPGIELIAPAFDILEYRGGITDMAFDRDFVQSLSAAMTRTYRRRARPDLPPATLECFDKANTYACYLDLIGRILTGEAWEALRRPESWPERLREQRFDALARLPEPDVHLPQARHVTGSGKLLSETG
jgi:glycosyltransferase involved in cell wall biosynthesis